MPQKEMEKRKLVLQYNKKVFPHGLSEIPSMEALRRRVEDICSNSSCAEEKEYLLKHEGQLLLDEKTFRKILEQKENTDLIIEIIEKCRKEAENKEICTDSKECGKECDQEKEVSIDLITKETSINSETQPQIEQMQQPQEVTSTHTIIEDKKITKPALEYVIVKDSNGVKYKVEKKKIISLNGKLYMLKKKKKNVIPLLFSSLSKYANIFLYLTILSILVLNMDKCVFFITLLFTILGLLDRVSLTIAFNRKKGLIRNLAMHILSFFVSFFLNPGYNLTLHMPS